VLRIAQCQPRVDDTCDGRVELEAADARVDREKGRGAIRVHPAGDAALPAAELEHDLVLALADDDLAERRVAV